MSKDITTLDIYNQAGVWQGEIGTEQMVQNIINEYLAVKDNSTLVHDGMVWYARANSLVQELAYLHGLPTMVVATMLSALSPRNNWVKNQSDLHVLLWSLDGICPDNQDYHKKYADYKYGAFATAIKKAINIHQRWLREQASYTYQQMLNDVGNGLKTRAFAQLCNDPAYNKSLVCVDTHAISGAVGVRAFDETTKKVFAQSKNGRTRYTLVANAYLLACYRLNSQGYHMSPYQLQAIVWLGVKQKYGI
jgi:hypothetical protein